MGTRCNSECSDGRLPDWAPMLVRKKIAAREAEVSAIEFIIASSETLG